MEGSKDSKSSIQRALETEGALDLLIKISNGISITIQLQLLIFKIFAILTEDQEPQL